MVGFSIMEYSSIENGKEILRFATPAIPRFATPIYAWVCVYIYYIYLFLYLFYILFLYLIDFMYLFTPRVCYICLSSRFEVSHILYTTESALSSSDK